MAGLQAQCLSAGPDGGKTIVGNCLLIRDRQGTVICMVEELAPNLTKLYTVNDREQLLRALRDRGIEARIEVDDIYA